MLTEILFIPELMIFFIFSSFSSVPLGDITILRPLFFPYSAISKISFLNNGSPPVRIMIGLLNETISSMRLKHSPVVHSSGCAPYLLDARQWAQAKLQLRVTSHAI